MDDEDDSKIMDPSTPSECTRTSIATSNEKRLQITKIHKQPKRRRRKERSKTTRRNKKKEAEAKAKAKAKAKNKYESERAESPCVAKGVQINRKIKTSDSCIDGRVHGLVNLGNTCFMNSTLQCLYHTKQLRDFYFKEKYSDGEPSSTANKTISSKFQLLLQAMSYGTQTFVAQTELKEVISKIAPRFCGSNQEDAQELLTFLLDGLHEDENKVKVKTYVRMAVEDHDQPENMIAKEFWSKYLQRNNSEIISLFYGQVRVETTCSNNSAHKDLVFETMAQLILPIPNVKASPAQFASQMEYTSIGYMDSISDQFSKTRLGPLFSEEMLELEDCFNLYTAVKSIEWYCSKCDTLVSGTRQTQIWKLPNILIIYIKRFGVSSYGFKKRLTFVNFPFELTMNGNYVADKSNDKATVYDLYSVVNHTGGSVYYGHYIAYVKSDNDQKWYCCDNSKTYEITTEQVKTKNAYILFYRKRIHAE